MESATTAPWDGSPTMEIKFNRIDISIRVFKEQVCRQKDDLAKQLNTYENLLTRWQFQNQNRFQFLGAIYAEISENCQNIPYLQVFPLNPHIINSPQLRLG